MANFKNFAITFCIAVILLGFAAYFVVTYAVDSFSDGFASPPPDTENSPSGEGAEQLPDTTEETDDFLTVLLIGTDYNPEVLNDYDLSKMNESNKGFPYKEREIHADSIVLLHINKARGEFVISPLPADLAVPKNGSSIPLCSVYDDGGAAALRDTVASLTGIPIQYHASVSFAKFAEIFDELGNIYYTVPVNMFYTDVSQNLKIDIKKGKQLITGKTASQMLRYCGYGIDSRTELAVDFLKFLLSELVTPENITKAPALYEKIKDSLDTDFTAEALAEHIDLIFSFSSLKLVDISYPGKYETVDGEKVFVPDITAAQATYKNYKFGQSEEQ